MKANMLSLHTLTTPGVGSKELFFYLKVVILHIKLKWKKCRPICKETLNLHTPLTYGLGLKVSCCNCADLCKPPIPLDGDFATLMEIKDFP